MAEIYLDHNATTPVSPQAVEAVIEVLRAGPANPSSDHAFGRRARVILAQARESVAVLAGAQPENVIFTASATEANHLVLQCLADGHLGTKTLVTSSVEHSSIRNALPWLEERGVEIKVLGVTPEGLFDLGELHSAIAGAPALVSLQWANSETGVRQSIGQVAELVAASGSLLHSDAVQGAGKERLAFGNHPIHFMTISAHKLNGPVGAAALITNQQSRLRGRIGGGSQESNLRPGTENVAAIAGFGIAAAQRTSRLDHWIAHTTMLRNRLENHLKASGLSVSINGGAAQRIPNTSNVAFHRIDGQALHLHLQRRGIACSQGSACLSHRPEPSYVLREMGLSEDQAWSSIRFSFGHENTEHEVDVAIQTLEEICPTLSRPHLISNPA